MNDKSENGFIMTGGTENMNEKKNWQPKIAGIFLILLGYFFGGKYPQKRDIVMAIGYSNFWVCLHGQRERQERIIRESLVFS